LAFRPVLDGAATAGLQQKYTALNCGPTGAPLASTSDEPTAACDRKAHQKYLLGPVALDGSDVKSATAGLDANGGGWIVNLDFTSAGSVKFARITGTLAAQVAPANQFAILVDGDVLSAPSVQQSITGGKAQISGGFTRESARNLATLVTTGALPVELTVSDITRVS
ncbi:SecDF P1 head subdomain-containing protein, partial [Streptomyces sp.]|uniref:SecDF P1 head subdomain-containing protein n=1 Tax=Streptomyces sp. TaxID=1931 RepID=UPI002F413388